MASRFRAYRLIERGAASFPTSQSSWSQIVEKLGLNFDIFLHSYSTTAKNKVQRLSRMRNKSRSLQKVEHGGLRTEPTQAEASGLQLVDRSALIVTRDIEWGQVLLGYEQANKYSIRDRDGNVVGLLAEQDGFGRTILRQLLRTRRGFTATIFNRDGSEILFKLRRPPYVISSTIYIEDADRRVLGEVQQEFHIFRRRYNLFIGKEQFARIDAPILAWEFLMTDEEGKPMALIDRNFSGFGKELFTDAGKYAIHFGETAREAANFVQQSLDRTQSDKMLVAPEANLGPNETAVIPCSSGLQLKLPSPLALDERMIALAAAISIDYDYFSRHSYGSGMLSPFIHPPLPMPIPVPGTASSEDSHMPNSDADSTLTGDHQSGGNQSNTLDAEDGFEQSFGQDNDDWGEYDDFGKNEDADSDSSSMFDWLQDWSEE